MNSLAKELAERIKKECVESDSPYHDSDHTRWILNVEKAAALIDSALPKWVEVTPETMPKFEDGQNSVACVCIVDGGQRIALSWVANVHASTERGRKPRWEWWGRVAPWKVTRYIPLSALPAAPSTDSEEK